MPADAILLIDDSASFVATLSRALQRRGLTVYSASSAKEALEIGATLQSQPVPPRYAVLDLKLPDESGLKVLPELLRLLPGIQIVMLTGYASIATAVQAVKLGAVQYLAKPVTANEILAALKTPDIAPASIPESPPSVARLEWEHIQRVLNEHDDNISATARALKMHRRTLQRKLAKRPVSE
jgi:two-component system response regulator RegA